ncbi:NADPH:quinone reductase [Lentzea sp. NBRC 105346]|uniref:medium chain dehydrogenase/reductase family protein n=1 Tax=Lentzea sp. NBRC 105346 TaxID=3032205 RepID=UPI002554C5D2|nr:medium chain dehydrogenase/reductase family protein [Lentzea sp. NBRC 105346]GLZ33830.1 NADPH:quinone reductase [Lentzea sp. NBRC 105346]
MSNECVEVVLPGVVEPEGLQVNRKELPVPGPGQVRVRVEATGVSFAEQQMRRGRYYDQPPFPFVPGYDLVGVVETTGRRVAALTKVGAWASHVVLDEADLVDVPEGVDPIEAETVVVNGITAWQMLHRAAKAKQGQTILVHGANGGVGSVLTRLAKAEGIHVIGTASPRHHEAIRKLGVTPIDYRDDVPRKVRELAPEGVDAVFDHIGGRSVVDSWRLLRKGGALVAYGSAATKEDTGAKALPVLKIVARTLLWNALPNGRTATFYNIWAKKFKAKHNEDLKAVLARLASGHIDATVAEVFPLEQAAAALRLAEERTTAGKIVLKP